MKAFNPKPTFTTRERKGDLDQGGIVRGHGENEPNSLETDELSKSGVFVRKEDKTNQGKGIDYVKSLLKREPIDGYIGWPAEKILRNQKLKTELINKIGEQTRNFPFALIDEILTAIAEEEARLKIKK